MTKDYSNLHAALDFADQGFPVFPLCPKSKVPLPGSRAFHDATLDKDLIRRLWEPDETRNIGIATGSISRLLVIDVDRKNEVNGFEYLDQLFPGRNIPTTRTVITPTGGIHLWFELPEGVHVPSRVGIQPGIDIRSDGGYIVAPPSKTEQGGYSWK